MARLRFMAVALLALALAGNSAQTGRSAGQNGGSSYTGSYSTTKSASANDRSCVIYSLTDMGYDADLGLWIAQKIPDMIEPSSWKEAGGSGVLRYYAPKNILIVNHSSAVRSKVDDFLKKLKTSLPKTSRTKFATSKKPSHASVVPAEYRAPALVRTSGPLPEPSSYPVPAPVKTPKHLFHFIIRYEGEGIIDDNVVKFMKGYIQASKDAERQVPVQVTAKGSVPCTPAMPTDSTVVGGPAMYSQSVSPPQPSATTASPVAQPKQPENKKVNQKEKSAKESR